ncbi:MAG: DUF4349 domain-containing protein [Bacteroidota bacterium]
MKLLLTGIHLLFLLSIIGCSQQSAGDQAETLKQPQYQPQLEQSIEDSEEQTIQRKLIKEGRVDFETNNLEDTRKKIYTAVESYKGYVASDEEYKYTGQISNTIVVRVPAEHFDQLLAEATAGASKLDNKSINIQDVTEEFLDVEARLKTKKELEARYLELLQQAKTVSEMLEIEQQIGQLRSDIESVEGRLTYLRNKVSLATLTISFYERVPKESGFSQKFQQGFRNGWENLVLFGVVLVNVWPFIVLGVAFLIGWRYKRKRNSK